MSLPTVQQTKEHLDVILADLNDPWHKQIFQNFVDHWWAEVIGDVEAAMATMPANPRYRRFGSNVFGEGLEIDDKETARAAYQSVLDAGLLLAPPTEDIRVAFADWGLMVECRFTTVLPGARLPGWPEPLEPEGLYLVKHPAVTVHPYDRATGLMAGEILYFGHPFSVEPCTRKEIDALMGR